MKSFSDDPDLFDNIKSALNRLENFNDSYEIAKALNEDTKLTYYAPEAAVHIEGLWELSKELARYLKWFSLGAEDEE